MRRIVLACIFTPILLSVAQQASAASGGAALGAHPYDSYETPEACGSCHTDFYEQWRQAMMSQCYTHHWDEIEYFRLAVPHAEKDEKVAEVKAGCNGCHAPLSFVAGDVPPPRPERNSRANESVSCDFCHTISGFEGEIPYNFNWITSPGPKKFGPKPGLESPYHGTEENAFMRSAEFCGTCHNEMSPYGAWVKATQIEWKEGPYSEEGVLCRHCHMPAARGKSAVMAEEGTVAQHLFHGAHDPGKLAGAVEIRMHPETREVDVRDAVVLKVQLFNAKAGHKIPTGSVEDRIVWLHVEAIDSKGKVYHLPVDPKSFAGEEYTIASEVLAYQDMGIALDIPNFKGVPRDGIPVGDRIFRMPYFDPKGRMTIQQWNTKSFGVDYRIGPRETKIETFTWEPPEEVAVGKVTFRAVLNYQKLVGPVAEFLGVPPEESEIVLINQASTWVELYD